MRRAVLRGVTCSTVTDMSDSPLEIRPVRLDDAEAAARLTGELGYPIDADGMRRRLEPLLQLADHVVFVAVQLGGDVLGSIHAAVVMHLQSEPRVEIGGLVVTETARGQRVGAQLVSRRSSGRGSGVLPRYSSARKSSGKTPTGSTCARGTSGPRRRRSSPRR